MKTIPPFPDRTRAGQLLAQRLKLATGSSSVVIALARGGVPIGYELAKELGIPLEVLVVRKIGAPLHPEYGVGAITEEGYYWINEEAARAAGINRAEIEKKLHQEHDEVDRMAKLYRGSDQIFPSVQGKTVIIVDDGIATGVTARMAIHYLKGQGADRLILAVPVCSPDIARLLRSEIDDVICLEEPEIFDSVSEFYRDFSQTTDEKVTLLLSRAKRELRSASAFHPEASDLDAPLCEEVLIEGNGLPSGVKLAATLVIPSGAQGLVIFAHGSGSGRLSSRNQQVAAKLNDARLGTLLLDLLSRKESQDRKNIFDIPLLASRLMIATQWLSRHHATQGLALGYFGASTGAGAALWAASYQGRAVSAIVSRGGRPELAAPRLSKVVAPTLLLVGENDEPVIEVNQEAMYHLGTSSLMIIPHASHLFEEPGALELVAEEAVIWFSRYFKQRIIAQSA